MFYKGKKVKFVLKQLCYIKNISIFKELMMQDVQSQPSVAIVILNWNGIKMLQKFLPSVVASTYTNKRIIVADNASTDDSILFLETQYPQIEIIKNLVNEGYAKGYNTALQQIKSDYFVLLNNDVEVTPNWILPIINLMESDSSFAACQPKILSYNNKKYFEYAGASGGWMDTFGYPFMRGRIFDTCEVDKLQYNNPQQCFWASGASLFVKANAFNEVGGLDEYFFAHQEEIDFCWRLQKAGYKIYVQPASVVYHLGGGTLPKGNNNKTFLNFRNNLIMLAKNYSLSQAIWKIPIRFFLDFLAACKGLFSGDTGYFFVIFKAHLQFLKWFFFIKKKPVVLKNKNTNFGGLFSGSIVWQYYIKKKKIFSEIIKEI